MLGKEYTPTMSKSNTVICAANKCYSSLLTHPSKSFFGFPSDISLCKIWLDNCGRTDLNLQQVCTSSYYRLCEDHFEDKWFTDRSRKMLLRKLNPVPTIFINNISSLLPSGTHPRSIDSNFASNPENLLCVELIEEENDLCEGVLDLEEASIKKKKLPISYDTKPLLKSVEFGPETARKTQLKLHNADTGIQNIDQICRFCLNEVSFNYIEIFSKTDDAKNIKKVSEIILPNKISFCNGMPHKVCQQCTEDLKMCWRLIEKFRNADQYLRSIAKHSLFTENEDITGQNIETEESISGINDGLNQQLLESVVVLPISPLKKPHEISYRPSGETNRPIDKDLEIKSSLTSKYVVTPNDSNDYEYSNWQHTSVSKGVASRHSSSIQKHKTHFNYNSKRVKKSKTISSEEFTDNVNVISTETFNHSPGLVTTYHMSNFGIVKPLEDVIFTSHKCI